MGIDIKLTSRIYFCPLQIRQEGEEYLVGREDVAIWLQMPEVGVRIIEALKTGTSLGEVASSLSQEYEEEVPVIEFVENLIENRLIHRVDEIVLEEITKTRYHLEKFPFERLAWLYSLSAFGIYASLVIFILITMSIYPQYIPQPKDYFPDTSYAASMTQGFLFSMLSLFIHELSHLAAARSIGVHGRISISNRLIFLVAQTDITNVWGLPRNKRYIPYLAGMVLDVIQMTIWLVFLILHDFFGFAVPYLIYGLAKQQLLLLSLSLVWQFRFYMQTDVYYVITNFLGHRNLIGDTKLYLRSILQQLMRCPPIDLGFSNREQRIVKYFVFLYIIGLTVTFYTFFGFTIPIILQGAIAGVVSLSKGYQADPAGFLDGLSFLLVFGIRYGVLIYVAGKDYWLRWYQWRRRTEAVSPPSSI